MDSTAPIEIRPAANNDASSILKCLAEAFAPYREQYSPLAFADTVLNDESIHVRLQQMHVLVATTAGNVVGTIAGTQHADEGHLRGMAVLPQWHGSGIALKLLTAIEIYLHSQGCKQITLDTTVPLEPAIRFYEKNGYQRSGNIQDFFGMPLIEYVKVL
jgi:ribosomal protein S18 acetylase RimI-like enzyme